jgi:hypothetical protein
MTTKAPHEKKSGLDAVKKWIGLAAAAISLGSAAYGVLRAQADMKERARTVTEQLETGHLQQSAGDYAQAWASFQKASEAAAKDGPIAKLLGGSSAAQNKARTAQEDLGMEWLRHAVIPEGHNFAEIADPVIKLLSADLSEASGARKADMLAHIGWGYFLKKRDDVGGTVSDPTAFYRQAVALDPTNPYANAFWGHLIAWNRGSVVDVQQHFAAALSSKREHDQVRGYQLSALKGMGLRGSESPAAEVAWWQTVNEMRKAGEPLDDETLSDMSGEYFFALGNEEQLKRLWSAVPPADHVELARILLKSPGGNGPITATAALALALELAGKPEEALTAWREVQALGHGQLSTTITMHMDPALKRLGTGAGKPGAAPAKRSGKA